MKAEISSTGVLKVTPETSLESYALSKWSDGYNSTGAECESVLQIEVIHDRDENHSEK